MYNRIVRKNNILHEILIKALSHQGKRSVFYSAYLATASHQLGMGLVTSLTDSYKARDECLIITLCVSKVLIPLSSELWFFFSSACTL